MCEEDSFSYKNITKDEVGQCSGKHLKPMYFRCLGFAFYTIIWVCKYKMGS